VLKTPAIVIRETDYRDNDKMLTLFSPTHGRIDVLSRGCKKPSSKLMASSTLFACGDFDLSVSKEKYYHAGCGLSSSFYGLREDYDKLQAASFYIELIYAFLMHEQENKLLYALLLNALYSLEKQINSHELITQFFLIKLSDFVGLRPNTDICCDAYTASSKLYFCYDDGCVACAACAKNFRYKKTPISAESVDIINQTILLPTKAILVNAPTKLSRELTKIFYTFLQDHIGVAIKSYKL
jgi:DNA repair protein RecO (recombination protein O)